MIGIDSITQVPFQAGAAGSTLTFMNLSRHFDITAVVQALQSASDARLLADPNVAVLENEEAIFENVQEIPYQQLTQTQQGGAIGTTAFKNAGIELHVTPKIAAEGIIRMTVNPKVSRLVGFTPGDNQPIIDTSSASTVLTIANRQTVVIGGLRQRSDVGKFNGIPYLKDMKVVGRLFRSHDTTFAKASWSCSSRPKSSATATNPTAARKSPSTRFAAAWTRFPKPKAARPAAVASRSDPWMVRFTIPTNRATPTAAVRRRREWSKSCLLKRSPHPTIPHPRPDRTPSNPYPPSA